MIVVKTESKLFEVVAATHTPGGLAGRLNSRQEQAHQNAYNGDDNKKFD
jgi:hypothetical protein